jgi:L-alanine-DL-glutamate epimerase-like enolase superfamily enzyme
MFVGSLNLVIERRFSAYRTLAQSLRTKVKIADIKCMIVRGRWDWNLIKIETDAGIAGIGEVYWGSGVKDLVLTQLNSRNSAHTQDRRYGL